MLQALFDFFYNLFQLVFSNGNAFEDYEFVVGRLKIGESYIYNASGDLIAINYNYAGGVELTLADYFATICSLISLIFIVVLCCLFVYKIIKLIGGLIR